MNAKKNIIDLFIDVGNQLIKIGYIDSNGQWQIHRFLNRDLQDQPFNHYFKSLKINHIYLGSVVSNTTKFLVEYFKKNNFSFTIITNDLFAGKIILNKNININEIGTDILGFANYIKNETSPTLCLNFGTATVSMLYANNKIEGVFIGPDFYNSYKYLYQILGVDLRMEDGYDKFGTNTIQSINGHKEYIINGFINEILKNYPKISKIVFTGGNRNIFYLYKNDKKIPIIEIDEAVLKGYYLLFFDK